MSNTPSTGHHEIDHQHAELDRLIDQVLGFCERRQNGIPDCATCPLEEQTNCRHRAIAMTGALLKFMVGHFRYEDQLMRGLPDNAVCREHIQRHQRAHADISAWVTTLTTRLETSNPYAVGAELQRILTEWTGAHAIGMDSIMMELHRQTGHVN